MPGGCGRCGRRTCLVDAALWPLPSAFRAFLSALWAFLSALRGVFRQGAPLLWLRRCGLFLQYYGLFFQQQLFQRCGEAARAALLWWWQQQLFQRCGEAVRAALLKLFGEMLQEALVASRSIVNSQSIGGGFVPIWCGSSWWPRLQAFCAVLGAVQPLAEAT